MSNFFPRWSNLLPFKLLVCLIFIGAGIVGGIWYYFTPKYTRVGYQPDQPIPFSHAIHVKQLGMDCRYCHSFVETAAHANIPNTQTCINCHGQGKVKWDSPRLAPVQESWKTGKPIAWTWIHKLPDYAYFNHAVHVNRGVSCYSCHGAINDMSVVYEAKPLSMAWCLECHRAPENFLRPPEEVFNMSWHPRSFQQQQEIGMKFKQEWNVNPPVTCGGCHR